MKHRESWFQLVAAARRLPAAAEPELPPGFVTRVAAEGLARRREAPDFLGAFARRALAAAFAVMVAAVAVSYPFVNSASPASEEFDDPVGELVAHL